MMILRRCTCFIILTAISFLWPAHILAAEEVRFSWAVLLDSESGLTALDFSKPQTVSMDSTLQLYLHPDQNTFVYVFLLDSSNYFTPIFPPSSSYYDNYPPGEVIRIPAGQDRFTIVPPAGQEKFYLLASPERLTQVEEVMGEYLQDPENIETQAELFKKVRYLRRKHSKLTQFTEKGMPVSGARRNLNATRGAEKSDDFVATHVVAKGFYSKILRLNHE